MSYSCQRHNIVKVNFIIMVEHLYTFTFHTTLIQSSHLVGCSIDILDVCENCPRKYYSDDQRNSRYDTALNHFACRGCIT